MHSLLWCVPGLSARRVQTWCFDVACNSHPRCSISSASFSSSARPSPASLRLTPSGASGAIEEVCSENVQSEQTQPNGRGHGASTVCSLHFLGCALRTRVCTLDFVVCRASPPLQPDIASQLTACARAPLASQPYTLPCLAGLAGLADMGFATQDFSANPNPSPNPS